MSIGAADAPLGDAAPPSRPRMFCKSKSCAPPAGVDAPEVAATGVESAVETGIGKFGVGRDEDVFDLSSVLAFFEALPEREPREPLKY